MQGPVLIIGGGGMLGQYLTEVFSDMSPTIWDKNELDITNAEMVSEKLGQLKPALVINAAAFNAVDACEEEGPYAVAMKVNADGPGNLARTCAQIGTRFVHVSTDYVFDGEKGIAYTEDDTPNPQSNYARSKRGGEEQVLAAGGEAYVARTCRLFGAPGTSEGSKQSFVDMMLTLAQGRDTLEVVDEEIASPTYTKDLAQQIRVLLEGQNGESYAPGVYHMTNEGACTWYAFAQEIFKQAGVAIEVKPVPASHYPRPAARPAHSELANTKLPAMRSWQEALAAYLSERE